MTRDLLFTIRDGIGFVTLNTLAGRNPLTFAVHDRLAETGALGVKDGFISSVSGRHDRPRGAHVTCHANGRCRSRLRPQAASHLVAWARVEGFSPYRDYAKIEPIFSDISAATCDVEFDFGYDDKPSFINSVSSGPAADRARCRHRRLMPAI